jgi:hypothetical protein
MRGLLATVVAIMVGLCAGGCGNAIEAGTSGRGAAANGSPSLPAGDYVTGDHDNDDSNDNGGEDPDDVNTRTYGTLGSAADTGAAEKVVKRYYGAIAAGDGKTACLLMDARLAKARDYTEVVPHEYAPSPGSSVFKNKSCAQVASVVYEPTHTQLVADVATVKVAQLRVEGIRALAILIYTTTPESEIPLTREYGVWKIDAFLAVPIL